MTVLRRRRCGAWHAAGFDEVVGIDIADHRKSYPGHFIRGDALNPPVRLEDFDFVWASPPCQAYSRARTTGGTEVHELIEPTRDMLSGHKWSVIENVPGAPISADLSLTGPQVGLPRLQRRRNFECSFFLLAPPPMRTPDLPVTVTKWGGNRLATFYKRKARGWSGKPSKKERADAMGLPSYLTAFEIGEAVPPAYAEFIAREALRQMQ